MCTEYKENGRTDIDKESKRLKWENDEDEDGFQNRLPAIIVRESVRYNNLLYQRLESIGKRYGMCVWLIWIRFCEGL